MVGKRPVTLANLDADNRPKVVEMLASVRRCGANFIGVPEPRAIDFEHNVAVCIGLSRLTLGCDHDTYYTYYHITDPLLVDELVAVMRNYAVVIQQ